jgi:hypothetical protein
LALLDADDRNEGIDIAGDRDPLDEQVSQGSVASRPVGAADQGPSVERNIVVQVVEPVELERLEDIALDADAGGLGAHSLDGPIASGADDPSPS